MIGDLSYSNANKSTNTVNTLFCFFCVFFCMRRFFFSFLRSFFSSSTTPLFVENSISKVNTETK